METEEIYPPDCSTYLDVSFNAGPTEIDIVEETVTTETSTDHQQSPSGHQQTKSYTCKEVGCNFTSKWKQSFSRHIQSHRGFSK